MEMETVYIWRDYRLHVNISFIFTGAYGIYHLSQISYDCGPNYRCRNRTSVVTCIFTTANSVMLCVDINVKEL